MKIQIIRSTDAQTVMNETNEFIKDKKVIDIKYIDYSVPVGGWFKGYEITPVSAVLIMYEELETQDNQLP